MRSHHQQQMEYVLNMKNEPRWNVSEKNCRLIQEINSTNLFHEQLDFCFTSDFLFFVFQVKLLQNGIEIYT